MGDGWGVGACARRTICASSTAQRRAGFSTGRLHCEWRMAVWILCRACRPSCARLAPYPSGQHRGNKQHCVYEKYARQACAGCAAAGACGKQCSAAGLARAWRCCAQCWNAGRTCGDRSQFRRQPLAGAGLWKGAARSRADVHANSDAGRISQMGCTGIKHAINHTFSPTFSPNFKSIFSDFKFHQIEISGGDFAAQRLSS